MILLVGYCEEIDIVVFNLLPPHIIIYYGALPLQVCEEKVTSFSSSCTSSLFFSTLLFFIQLVRIITYV